MADRSALAGEAKTKVKAAIPNIIMNVLIAALLWVFGTLIFVPLSSQFTVLDTISIDRIVAAIFLIAILLVFIRVFVQAKNLADGLADLIAASIGGDNLDSAHLSQHRGAIRWLFYVIGAVIAYLFVYPFLSPIAAPFAGIVFLALALWAISVLFRIGSTLTQIIDHWAGKVSDRIDQVPTPTSATGSTSNQSSGSTQTPGASV